MRKASSIPAALTVKRFQQICFLTVGAVVFLILVGGIVRMTGSGMGCPDWPKCFGQWIPPTDVSQLPADYQVTYKDRGYADTTFNAFKTWVEYVNRLIGVLIGLFSLGTAVYSLKLRKTHSSVTALSFFALFLVIIQGGIGAYVVRTNLEGGVITIHMIIALTILGLYVYTLLLTHRATRRNGFKPMAVSSTTALVGGLFLLMIIAQIVMGTQVREAIDHLAKSVEGGSRDSWIGKLDGVYPIHKVFYYAMTIALVIWLRRLSRLMKEEPLVKRLAIGMGVVFVTEVIAGISMHNFAIPAFLQPVHLLGATLLFGIAFSLWMVTLMGRSENSKDIVASRVDMMAQAMK
ncbi:MAG: COX15/CtaA family protein [Bacteroidota bacterium]